MLAVLCFQAVAQGWPAAYMKNDGPLGLDGRPQMRIDVNAMIAAGADIAATMTQAVDERMQRFNVEDDLMSAVRAGSPQASQGLCGEGL